MKMSDASELKVRGRLEPKVKSDVGPLRRHVRPDVVAPYTRENQAVALLKPECVNARVSRNGRI